MLNGDGTVTFFDSYCSTTNETEYMLSGLPPGECSVSVQAVWNENSAVVSGVGSKQISIPSEFMVGGIS